MAINIQFNQNHIINYEPHATTCTHVRVFKTVLETLIKCHQYNKLNLAPVNVKALVVNSVKQKQQYL